MNRSYLIPFIIFLFLLYHSSTKASSDPVTVPVVVNEPVVFDCRGGSVLSYGFPDYESDASMSHMVGVGCSNDNQCNLWPPKGTVSGETYCCMGVGVCVSGVN